ncbi:MAG: M48 family metalloprotease [Pseudohongiellaceae bacterium]
MQTPAKLAKFMKKSGHLSLLRSLAAIPAGIGVITLTTAMLLSLPLSGMAQSRLPSLGDRISGFVSMEDEYKMGREFLRSIRRSTPTISDPLLNNYLENLTYRLASKSELQDHRLAFVVIDSENLNAFAAPGGIIGVNTGLFLNAETEAEFASVLAHEIAHVSQRHFARSVEEAQRSRIPQIATLLASVMIMASGNAEHGQAAIMAAQGQAVENRLRFSRSNEAEADRVGIRTLYEAGLDPHAMPALFERLASMRRYGSRPPEFLLSHPVTESRISDSRGRASRYPRGEYEDSLEYLIMRARTRTHYATNKKTIIAEYQRALQASESEVQRDGNRYGVAMAYWEDEQYGQAAEALAPLLEKEPNRISYVVTQSEILTAQNEPQLALQFLERHRTINPGNHPLIMAYADALVESRQYTDAVNLLKQHVIRRPDDYHLWYLLAEYQGLAGDISGVHQARAEYFVLTGNFTNARDQLQYALRIETENAAPDSSTPLVAALRQRIREVEELQQQATG